MNENAPKKMTPARSRDEVRAEVDDQLVRVFNEAMMVRDLDAALRALYARLGLYGIDMR